jgi:hypothetical protein
VSKFVLLRLATGRTARPLTFGDYGMACRNLKLDSAVLYTFRVAVVVIHGNECSLYQATLFWQ